MAAPAATGAAVDGPPVHKSFLIGVTGGTGSGKTFVCRMIVDALAAKGVSASRVQILSQECFDKDVPAGQAGATHNFDHPNAFDEEKMVEALTALKAGQVGGGCRFAMVAAR